MIYFVDGGNHRPATLRTRKKPKSSHTIGDGLEASVQRQPPGHKQYLERHVTPTLLMGLSEMYEVRPDSPVSWLANWLNSHNPNKHDIK